jgi:hypothetical protein
MQIALGKNADDEDVALLVADEPPREISGLPLGLPLVRADPPDLLLPRDMHLRPTLPPDLLIPALRLPPDTLTVLTPARRYTVVTSALQPLASLLKLDAPAHTSTHSAITIVPVSPDNVPPLDLSDLPAPEPSPAAQPAPRPEPPPPPSPKPDPEPWPSPPTAHTPAFEEELRQRATHLEQSGDYATAAVFYDYLRDDERAAACYQRVLSQQL